MGGGFKDEVDGLNRAVLTNSGKRDKRGRREGYPR